MTSVLEIGILLLTCVSVIAFALYVVGLTRLSAQGRPKVPALDRFGHTVGVHENPGFEETEDERQDG